MRKHLQIALMAGSTIAASLSLTTPQARAAPGAEGSTTHLVATTDANGRTIYENEYAGSSPAQRRSESSAVGDQGGVEFQSQCALPQGCHGSHAIDAQHSAVLARKKSL